MSSNAPRGNIPLIWSSERPIGVQYPTSMAIPTTVQTPAMKPNVQAQNDPCFDALAVGSFASPAAPRRSGKGKRWQARRDPNDPNVTLFYYVVDGAVLCSTHWEEMPNEKGQSKVAQYCYYNHKTKAVSFEPTCKCPADSNGGFKHFIAFYSMRSLRGL